MINSTKKLTLSFLYVIMGAKRGVKVNLTEKLKIAMIKQNITQTALAERTGQTQNNLANKFSKNNFKLSEYQKLLYTAAVGSASPGRRTYLLDTAVQQYQGRREGLYTQR